MSKKENHRRDLTNLLDRAIETGHTDPLIEYILSNSNLPGQRANLELAEVFADLVQDRTETEREKLWELCAGMAEVSADEAPVNDPKEFLSFCGAIGIGSIGAIVPERFERALTALRTWANDPRWRMREATCFGLQRLLAKRRRDTLQALNRWIADGTWLELRAVAATVAEPGLLKDRTFALSALQLHEQILARVTIQGQKGKAFKVLRKALGYTLSVVVQALPDEGFEWMARLVDTQDADVLWIVKQNLKKNRLVKNYPDQVEAMKRKF